MVKNTVIVPVGSKGGFFVKQSADPAATATRGSPKASPATSVHQRPARHHRQPGRRQGRASGRRRAPRRRRSVPGRRRRQGHRDVLRHRQRHRAPSTASGSTTRSRRAARSATTTRAWASPRAARGNRSSATSARWAATARREDFTCVGIGDMSGDVFGNGMLLSQAHPPARRVRPPPHLPRSRSGCGDVLQGARSACSSCRVRAGTTTTSQLISKGGGVFPRTRQVDPAVAGGAARRSASTTASTAMSPNELMSGDPEGAGRPAVERRHRHLRQGQHARPHADVGDRANNALRVNGERAALQGGGRGRQPRLHPARPHRGRAWHGVLLNTDFIDNSAGVDTSDHEVNIKILLNGEVQSEEAHRAERATSCWRR